MRRAPGSKSESVVSVTVLSAVDPIEWVVAPFRDSVTMQRGLWAGTFAAIACGLVGTWVVLRGMTFLGDALAHGVVPGLAIATVIGFNLTVGALISAAVMVLGITVVGRRTNLTEDTSIGLLFVGMLAVGVLVISSSQSFAGELTGFLFGGITSVTTVDLWLGAGVAVGVIATMIVGYRAFIVLAFNRGTATLLGLRPGLTHAVLLVLVTATVVASFKTVGSLLVFALDHRPGRRCDATGPAGPGRDGGQRRPRRAVGGVRSADLVAPPPGRRSIDGDVGGRTVRHRGRHRRGPTLVGQPVRDRRPDVTCPIRPAFPASPPTSA